MGEQSGAAAELGACLYRQLGCTTGVRTVDLNDAEDFANRVYEAATLPEFWPSVLRNFAALAESRHACLIATNGESSRWVGSSEAMQVMTRETYTYPGGHERTRRLLAAEPQGFITDLDVFTNSELRAEPLYTDYLVPRGLGRGIATTIRIPSEEIIVFHAEGDQSLGPLTATLRHRLNGLRPHLARSALISARLAFERARTAVETLAAIGLAACSVSQVGKVMLANAAFDAHTSLWTTRGDNRIALLDRRADRQLYEGLATIGTSKGVRSLPMLAQDGGRPAVLHIVPVRRAAHDLFIQANAILVLTLGSDEPVRSTSLLQALFDLSPAEALVAAHVAAGQTADEIARTRGKSVETIRNQLKSVLEKTGCRRQVDLARLLAQLLPATNSPFGS